LYFAGAVHCVPDCILDGAAVDTVDGGFDATDFCGGVFVFWYGL